MEINMHPPTTFPQFPVNWANVIILQAGLWVICVGGILVVLGKFGQSELIVKMWFRRVIFYVTSVLFWAFALGNMAIMLECFPHGTTHIVRDDLFWAGNDIPFATIAIYMFWRFTRNWPWNKGGTQGRRADL